MTGKRQNAGGQGFGVWLKRRRRALDLTQQQLAGQIACSVSALKKIEAGTLTPSRQLSELIATALGVPAEARAAFVQFARGGAPLTEAMLVSFDSPARVEAASERPRLTLPAPLTSLVGRAQEIAAGVALLRNPNVRLLTLTGAPGAGKTRLAIAIASALQDDFADGAGFVALGTVTDAAEAPAAIAQALGVTDARAPSLLDALTNYARSKRLLLALDNFEQILPAAPIVQALLEAAPRLKIIVTSRALLRLYGEHELVVPPLALPDLRHLPPVEELRLNPSVALFIDRARAVRSDFELNAGNTYSVAAICAWLDGLPLAIEMAAARLKWQSPEIVLTQLSHRLDLSGPHETGRQHTLRSAIAWSYDLLTLQEQRLMATAAMFADRFSAEAAGAALGLPESASPVMDTLTSLADKSLLTHSVNQAGEPRFRMLNVIRDYARERLAQSGESEDARRRWATHYLALARQAQPHLSGPQQRVWLDRLDEELSNLRAVIDWCAAHDCAAGVEIVTALQWYLYARGHVSEARLWLTRLLRGAEEGNLTPAALARARCAAGFFAWQQGDHAESVALSRLALDAFQRLGDRLGAARALRNLGSVALLQSDYARAGTCLSESLALFRSAGSAYEMALALNDLGLTAKDLGQYERARAYHQESLRLHQRAGNRRGVAQSLLYLSIVAYWQADFVRAGQLSERAATLNQELGNRAGLAYSLDTLGAALHKLGDAQRALATLQQSLALFEELGDRVGMALAQSTLGMTHLDDQRPARAAEHFSQALQLSQAIGDKRRAAFALEGLAGALACSQPVMAARLFGTAHAVREAIGAPTPAAESASRAATLKAMQAALGQAGYEAECAHGQSWTLADACRRVQDGTGATG